MWRRIKFDSNDNTGQYQYINFERELGYGGKSSLSQSGVYEDPEMQFINAGGSLVKDKYGNERHQTNDAILSAEWCSGIGLNPEMDDMIYDLEKEVYYRVVGIADYSEQKSMGIYYLSVRREESAVE